MKMYASPIEYCCLLATGALLRCAPTLVLPGSGALKKPSAGVPSAPSREVRINVFLLSDRKNNSDEVLESRGFRYTYFNSNRLASPPRLLAEPKPRCPAGKRAERDGAVLLQLHERGMLDYVDVICVAPAFEKSALDSMRGMKFVPARGKDGPVDSYMRVELAYGLAFPAPPRPTELPEPISRTSEL